MGAYDRARDTAARMLAAKGREVTLVTYDGAVAPDPDRPWDTTWKPSGEQTVRAVFLASSEVRKPGELTHTVEQRVLLAAKGLETPPTANGAIVAGDQTYRIVSVEPLSPGGDDILYTLTVAA